MIHMIGKVTYVTLLVSDQDKALDFYTKTLGFEKRGDNPTPQGPRFLTVGPKGQDLQIILWPGTQGSPTSFPGYTGYTPGMCFLETNDLRKDLEAFKSRGAKFEEARPVEQPYGVYATLLDPDGNRLTLREAPRTPTPSK